MDIAVSYEKDDVDIECGPFSAKPGTLWQFTHNNCYEAGLLSKGEDKWTSRHNIQMLVYTLLC